MTRNTKPKIIIISNLYPLPWQPNRATFNRQQFNQLHDSFDVAYLIPIAFLDWWKNRKLIKQQSHLRYLPYFYLPGIARRLNSVWMYLSILLHSGLWIRQHKPKILFASWAFPEAVAVSWLSNLFNTHFFFKVHGSDINIHAKIAPRAKQIVAASHRAIKILSVSQALADEMVAIGIDSDKIQVVYNGVDHTLFNNRIVATPTEDYFVFIGNLKPDKGVMELLRGFQQYVTAAGSRDLMIVGDGAMRAQIVAFSQQHQLEERIHIKGVVSHKELPQIIANAKAVVLPSYNEGVPNVLLESMACGTPVIATQVGGIPEIVNIEFCGDLVAPKQAEAVAKCLLKHEKWLADRDKIASHAQKFCWEKNKQALITMLLANKD